MRIMLIGDSHGNDNFIRRALQAASEEERCTLAIQLGDFGFWPGWHGERFIEAVHAAMTNYEMPLWVVDGNHDWPEMYRAFQTAHPSETDFSRIQVLPRGTVLHVNGRSIGFLGSAVSIDQEHRTEGRSWWADEALTDADVQAALAAGKAIDIMLSHDAPIPPTFRELSFGPRVDAQISEQAHRLLRVIEHWRPKLHVHGHWHHRYTVPTPWGTRLGLSEERQSSIAVLDTETLEAS